MMQVEERNRFALNVLKRVRVKLEGREPDSLRKVKISGALWPKFRLFRAAGFLAPGSGSIITRYKSGYFYNQSKIVRKTLVHTVL
jgi:hypothetical protein